MKTLEEMQADARKKNDAEADRLCKKCQLCIGWCTVICLFIWSFTLIIKISFTDFDNHNGKSLIIEEFFGSGSI
tara:strand:- start:184 stop:405 length:222 start_codon:yes stop_codon:yes gene_type:complete